MVHMRILPFALILILPAGAILFGLIPDEDQGRAYLENSAPHIKADILRADGIDGTGITVAVIDTGVDFNHPDLFGWGEDGKVVGGYNFIHQGTPPIDTDGHGTQVAGIIAADGELTGIAPKARILAYKVSEDGEGVSSDLIAKAISMAISDGADVINISLGVNTTNPEIDRAVNQAVEDGVFVVVAAGNDGPEPKTIGSPGGSTGAMTVGATYNNITTSLVATLEIGKEQYTVIPMVGSPDLDEPITGEIVFGGYGKVKDLDGAEDAIVLVERGSDVEGQMLYFSIKEKNAADAGAKAMIVYNNEQGLFLGELIHEFIEPGYEPRIPVVSMEREEGLKIRNNAGESGAIHVFYNPDFVAYFSSRGPVSPFYIKPDIMAPGAYINTTRNDSMYNLTSGTSYAAPHVAGAVALLLQKNPDLDNSQIRSILMTTAVPVSDPYGVEFSVQDAGSGRLNLAGAYEANLVITPPNIVTSVSPDRTTSEHRIEMMPIDGVLGDLSVKFEGPESIKLDHFMDGNILHAKVGMAGSDFGDHEGRLIVSHGQTRYSVPILIHHTQGSVSVTHEDQSLLFEVRHPDQWDFAKISVINGMDGRMRTVTATPDRDASIEIYRNTEYWIDTTIVSDWNVSEAYETVTVDWLAEERDGPEPIDISARHLGIIAAIAAMVGTAGMVGRRIRMKE